MEAVGDPPLVYCVQTAEPISIQSFMAESPTHVPTYAAGLLCIEAHASFLFLFLKSLAPLALPFHFGDGKLHQINAPG